MTTFPRRAPASGAWAGYSYWSGALEAAWYINILNATTTVENKVPLPGAVWLFGTGLLGLGAYGRKRRKSKS